MPMIENSSATPNTIIHLGAGHGQRLQEFRDAGAHKIILVEPQADAARNLARSVGKHDDVDVFAAAISTNDGEGNLWVMNLPTLNSVAKPTAELRLLYPGYRVREKQQIKLLSPANLMRDLGEFERPLLLVVETPGSEMAVLEAWKVAGLLDQIDLLELRCSEEKLYEGAATRADLEAWLIAEGFGILEKNRTDPDWPVLKLHADEKARALVAAEMRISELESVIEQDKISLKSRTEERDAALSLAADLERMAEQRETALADMKGASSQGIAVLAKRDTELKTAIARVASLEGTISQLRKQLAQLTDDRQRDALDLRSAMQNLGRTIRQQERLQNDLRDLQERYEAVQAVRRDQDDLLRRLTPRLQEAALHLQGLTPKASAAKIAGSTDNA